MSNKEAKQMIERLTGAYFSWISIPVLCLGYSSTKLVYGLNKCNARYKYYAAVTKK